MATNVQIINCNDGKSWQTIEQPQIIGSDRSKKKSMKSAKKERKQVFEYMFTILFKQLFSCCYVFYIFVVVLIYKVSHAELLVSFSVYCKFALIVLRLRGYLTCNLWAMDWTPRSNSCISATKSNTLPFFRQVLFG